MMKMMNERGWLSFSMLVTDNWWDKENRIKRAEQTDKLSNLLLRQLRLRRKEIRGVCRLCGSGFSRQRVQSKKAETGGTYFRLGPAAAWCYDCRGEKSSNDGHYEFDSLLVRYNVGAREWKILMEDCGGVCKICKRPPKVKKLSVDHDHVTGRVRGLLCASCNSHVGFIEDIVKYNEALDYLVRPLLLFPERYIP